jgi:hypothetical protein
MKIVGIIVACLACGSGLWAAYLWLQASKVERDLGLFPSGRPAFEMRRTVLRQSPRSEREQREWFEARSEQITLQEDWMMSTWEASDRSALLNRQAAIWTAVSVTLSGISTIFSSLG